MTQQPKTRESNFYGIEYTAYHPGIGEVGLIFMSGRYKYTADTAVIKRFVSLYKRRYYVSALTYLKSFALSYSKVTT